MYPSGRQRGPAPIERRHIPVFTALGERTRLELVVKLSDGEARSIADLTEGTRLSRQAISKHLTVLERAGLVRGRREGRESRFELVRDPLGDARRYLESIVRGRDAGVYRRDVAGATTTRSS